MTICKLNLGPLTVGTLLGAGIGMLDTVPLLDSIRQGTRSPDIGSVLLVPFGFAFLGGMLGIASELVIRRHPIATKGWFRHFLRPILLCTVPYLLIALSFKCFGDSRLMGGFGFWICVIIIPLLGMSIAWRRSTDMKFDEKFSGAPKRPITNG